MPLKIPFLCMVIFLCYCTLGVDTTKKYGIARPTKQQGYYQQVYGRYYKKYKYWSKKKWPKVKGRCSHSPWEIDGVNPVMEEAKRGNMVVLLMLKPNTRFAKHQLDYLNDLIGYYKNIAGWKVSLMVLIHRSKKLPEYLPRMYKHIKFYQEPRAQNIFKILRATYGHIITYDECGRQQYSIGPPYSYQRYDFVGGAIKNTKNNYISLCGKCLPPTQQTVTNSTASFITTSVQTKLSTKPPKKPTDPSLDGPYTNIPTRN